MRNSTQRHEKTVPNRASRGFGLTEVMVSTAILGVIIYAAISQQKLASKNAETIHADTTVNDVMRRLITEINDQGTCEANFKSQSQSNTYTSLVNTSGTAIVAVGADYGRSYDTAATGANDPKTTSGEIRLKQIRTLPTSPASNNVMLLRLTFTRKNKNINALYDMINGRDISRDIPINTVMSSGTISTCFGDFNLLARSAIEASCQNDTALTGGQKFASIYQAPGTLTPASDNALFPYGRCVHQNIDPTATCGTGKILRKVDTDANNATIYECADISSACPAGQVITAYKTDGTVECNVVFNTNKVTASSCSPGQVLVKNSSGQIVCTTIDCSGLLPISAFAGFLPSGAAHCAPITTLRNCGTDNYATDIQADGTITCSSAQLTGISCSANAQMRGVDSNGNAYCENFLNPFMCPAGQALKSIDANGNATCAVVHKPLGCSAGYTAHSDVDCLTAPGNQGIAYQNTAAAHCIFGGDTCPSGWSRCNLNGNQYTNSCTDTSETYYCGVSTRYAYPGNNSTIVSGSYINAGKGSVQCVQWTSSPLSGHSCWPNPYAYPPVTFSIQATVGCY